MDEMVFIMVEHFKEYGHAYRKLLKDRKKRVTSKITKKTLQKRNVMLNSLAFCEQYMYIYIHTHTHTLPLML